MLSQLVKTLASLVVDVAFVAMENWRMTEPKRLLQAALPLLTEEDFEQLRVDTRKLVVENEQLRLRIAQLESHIVTHGWAERKLH